MSAWDLRWILLLIGIVILVVLYMLGRRHRTRRSDGLLDVEEDGEQIPAVFINPSRERQDPQLDGMDDELQMLDSLVREAAGRPPATPTTKAPLRPAAEPPPMGQPAPRPGAEPPPMGQPAPRSGAEPPPMGQPAPRSGDEAPSMGRPAPRSGDEAPSMGRPAPRPGAEPPPVRGPREEGPKAETSRVDPESERLIVMHVAVPRPNRIRGRVLFAALEAVGLTFNEQLGIYQWLVVQSGQSLPVFQVANMINPGTFDPSRGDEFSTPGLSLFMQLPGPMAGLKALNTMLECAQGLAARMDAQLLDQHRSILTAQAAELMREEIQLYSLRHEHRRPA